MVAFLGGGRITSALAAGLRLAGDGREIVVYDRHPDKLKALRRDSRVKTARDVKSAVKLAEILVFAVRPGSMKAILEEVVEPGLSPRLCVSLAAGVPLQNLRAWLSGVRWVRAMPSPVCRTACGLTAVCFDRTVGKSDHKRVWELFERVGQVVEIPEKQFDAYTATFSSSHGYHALVTLAKAAQRAGLGGETALLCAAHALCDGIQYWRESRLSLNELLHEAATPGGTAAATMDAMNRAGYARAVAKGLAAGIDRARRNAKSR